MFVYVASPYTSQNAAIIERRVLAVQQFCAELVDTGRTPYSPVVHFHYIYSALSVPRQDADFWQWHNRAMLRYASKLFVLMLPGHAESRGVQAEVAFARSLQIPIDWKFPSERVMEILEGKDA